MFDIACRYCEQNPDASYNTCDAPQELSDQEIDLNLASLVYFLALSTIFSYINSNVALWMTAKNRAQQIKITKAKSAIVRSSESKHNWQVSH